MMIKDWSRSLMVIVCSSGCERFTNPSGYAYGQAQALSDAGKFDEAENAFKELEKDYPDTPVVNAIPKAMTELRFRRAQAAFDAGNFVEAGRLYVLYMKSPGVTDAPTRSSDLYLAGVFWSIHDQIPLSDDGLKFAAEIKDTLTGAQATSPFLKQVISWTCDNRKSFPAWNTCSEVPVIAIGQVVEARKRETEAEIACSKFTAIASLCEPAVNREMEDLPNGALALLKKSLAIEAEPVSLDYENLIGTWSCTGVDWLFTDQVVVPPYRMGHRVNPLGNVSAIGYLLGENEIIVINAEDGKGFAFEGVTLMKGEMKYTGIRTPQGLADLADDCFRTYSGE